MSPWPSLRARYGDGLSPKRLLQRALREEVPGGAQVLDALDLANRGTKWGDEEHHQAATLLVSAAQQQSSQQQAGDLGERILAAAQLAQQIAAAAGSDWANGATFDLRDTLAALRDELSQQLLERHTPAGDS
jgi:hypothetical protein